MMRASIPTTTDQNRNVTRPDYWLAKFSKLRGAAPHGDPHPAYCLLLSAGRPPQLLTRGTQHLRSAGRRLLPAAFCFLNPDS